ncbi:MAG TPA: DMT family transporter [Dehalococcoidia bacterium]|nr:DMT family transporter [Dehalococcoidia bacterium]
MNRSLVMKGTYLALATALISGVSVYVNSFGVKQVPDPFVFTTVKNLLVAVGLVALVLLPGARRELQSLTRKQWLALLFLGLVGGSVPFLLFFYGLSQATAPSAAFIHKTLFIWVAILAVPLLGERIGKLQLLALATLVIGNLALVGRPAQWGWGPAELFVLAATLLWAVEAVVARRLMAGISPRTAILGRMGFGAIVMLGFLAVTGRTDAVAAMSGIQWSWVLITSIFLLGYVTGYYHALKNAPATLVASVLVLGSVVTSLLHAVFSARNYSPEQVFGFGVILAATALWVYIGLRLRRQEPDYLALEVIDAGR